MKVIGIIGRMGSGKTEAAEYLHRRYALPVFSIGGIVREIAEIEGLPPTRTNLNDLSQRYAEEYGPELFARRAVDKIHEQPETLVAITGIRTPADVVTLRSLLDEAFVLIHIDTTAASVRFERLQRRGLERDPQTYDAFLRQDQEEERRFNLSAAISQADRVIRNDGSLAEFYEQIEQVIVQSLLAREQVSG